MKTLALTADLMFAARIRATAQAVGADLQLARTPDELLRTARENGARRVLLDLDARTFDPVDVIRTWKADPELKNVPIVAYVSHVNAARISAARLVGADQVLARSAFVAKLAGILTDSAG